MVSCAEVKNVTDAAETFVLSIFCWEFCLLNMQNYFANYVLLKLQNVLNVRITGLCSNRMSLNPLRVAAF